MANAEDLEAELAAMRKQLVDVEADAELRVDAVKRQLVEAKTRAKAVIQRSMAKSKEKTDLLAEQNKLQTEELAQLKSMLRASEQEKSSLAEASAILQKEVEEVKEQFDREMQRAGSLDEQLSSSLKDLDMVRTSAKAERETMSLHISSLESELREAKRLESEKTSERESEAAKPVAPGVPVEHCDADVAQISDLKELEEAKEHISTLEETCAQLKETANTVDESVADESHRSLSQTAEEREQELQNEISMLKGRAEGLEAELEKLREQGYVELRDRTSAIEKLQNENTIMEEKLRGAEDRVKRLESDIEKSEAALQEERERALNATKTASESSAGGAESKLLLETKIADMERVVASKQAEIGKVREKARTYLKELNAEKREMESKMKQELEALRNEVEEEQGKVTAAEQRTESVASELDNCLALIREKQKSVQMLKMAVSTQKKTSDDATRETKALRAEFIRYKERARIALHERENAAADSDAAVEAATSSLRKELEDSRKQIHELRSKMVGAREDTRKYEQLLDRAQRAEAAVDLLRTDATGASTANYGKIDALEEKISLLQAEVGTARTATGDAEARHETTKMRLEAVERALRGAELRAEEAARIANNTIEGLRAQIATLESALERAQESSAAAQRTAAAAAKALAFSATPASEEEANDAKRVSGSPNVSADRSVDGSPYANMSVLNGGRSSFAAAMDGHSDSLGLKGMNNGLMGSVVLDSDVTDGELVAKEQQITVLTSQVAELGALLDDAQEETQLRAEQTKLLKAEVQLLAAKLAAAEKLQNGAPFSYLRTIVVRYLETDDPTLLPVIANVLSFTKEESSRIKADRRSTASASSVAGASQKSNYFSIPFLGSR